MSLGEGLENSAQKRGLRKHVVRLAWPVLIEQLLQMAVGLVDVAMVGRVGPSAIAAVGFANSLLMLVIAVFAAISVGTTALVARYMGAGDKEQAHVVARQSLVLSIILGIIITLLGIIFPEQGLQLMMSMQNEPDPEVLKQGALFIRVYSYSMVPGLIIQIVSGILRGAGDTQTSMRVNVIVNIVNIVGNLILIGGIKPFSLLGVQFPGIPALGVLGSASASAVARALGGYLILWVLFKGGRIIHLGLKDKFKPDFPEIRRILKIGVPAALEQLMLRGGQMVFSIIVGGLGTIAYAAHNVTINAESLSFLPGFAFAVSATTLVGQGLGAQNPKLSERCGIITTQMAVLLMTIMGIIFFLFARPIVQLFSPDPGVIELGAQCLRIVAIAQPSTALTMVMAGSLRGAGDTRAVLYITASGIWCVRVVLAYILVVYFHLGLTAAWMAIIVDLIYRSILFCWRFFRGKWKTIQV